MTHISPCDYESYRASKTVHFGVCHWLRQCRFAVPSHRQCPWHAE